MTKAPGRNIPMLNLQQWLPASKAATAKAANSALAILQFDATGIAAVRVRQEDGGLSLLSHAALRGQWSDEDGSLEAALRAFAAEHLDPADAIYSVLPRYEITTRLLELPSQDDAEIDGMLHLNAEEHVPYAADELLIRHARLHSIGGESLVLAVFARNNVVDSHLALLQGAGLEPERILLSTACLLSTVAATAPAEPERFAIAHLATGGLEVAVFNERKTVFMRGVSMPHGWALTEEGAAPDELMSELRASLSAYRRESLDGMGVDQIFISSDWAPLATICPEIEGETGKDCVAAEFLRGAVRNGAAVPSTLPAVLLGGALSAAGKARFAIDLLPEHVRQSRQMTGLRVQFLRTAVLVLLMIILAGGLYVQRVWQYRAYINELEAQVEKLAPQAEGVAEKQAQLNIIARQVNREGSVLDLLGATVGSLPEKDINITRFSYDRKTGMEIWGRALTVDDVSSFAANMRAAGAGALSLLQSAHRMYEQKDVEREQEIMLYHVAVPTAEMEEEAAGEASP